MLDLQLHIQPRTEQQLQKIFNAAPNQEVFAQNIIAYHVTELHKGILNLRIDLKQFENTYHMITADFYQQFQQGKLPDSEDFIMWAGLYEMLCANERRLQEFS